jgi:Ca-activated chloride channel family protein
MKFRSILTLSLTALTLAVVGCQQAPPLANAPGTGNVQLGSNSITPPPKGPLPTRATDSFLQPVRENSAAIGVGATLPAGKNAVLPPNAPQPMPASGQAGGGGSATGANDSALTAPVLTTQPVEPTPTPVSTPTSEPSIQPSAEPEKKTTDYFYFSYDDSASTAGVELTKYALKQGFAPTVSWARPWEFLNYESFVKQGQESTGLFKVSMGLWQHGSAEGQETGNTYDLGIHVSAPDLDVQQRQNLALTLVVDVSGSMNEQTPVVTDDGRAPSLLDVAKAGLESLAGSLKPGDVVNLVTFSTSAVVALENFTYEGDASKYLNVVRSLQTQGGTNLDAGIRTAYALAQKSYQPGKINRVLMLTDAFANIGQVDSSVIAQNTRINNAEGIYFSGLGFGQNFNEAFLNKLTEAGRGAYFSVITRNDAERAFKERFMALMTVAARDVQFRLDYPIALKHAMSAAEQSSKVQSEVQPTNFSYNTSQYFWERFQAGDDASLLDQSLTLTIMYKDPQTGVAKEEVFKRTLKEILGKDVNNIKDARMITLLTSLIKKELTPEAAKQELNKDLGDYASALSSEYRKLIESFFKLSNTP